MDVLHPCCCGLDVHKTTVVACLITTPPAGPADKVTRTFGTMTQDLLALADWLSSAGCTHVAMESTGEFIPVTRAFLNPQKCSRGWGGIT